MNTAFITVLALDIDLYLFKKPTKWRKLHVNKFSFNLSFSKIAYFNNIMKVCYSRENLTIITIGINL